MIDLTQHSDQELSLQVFNTESLYNDRHKGLVLYISELFTFTDTQLDVLLKDLTDDAEELDVQ